MILKMVALDTFGDEKSRRLFNPIEEHGWHIDKLIIGNYVCIASGVVILMGGNHNHHPEWITVYPFVDQIETSYAPKAIPSSKAMPGLE